MSESHPLVIEDSKSQQELSRSLSPGLDTPFCYRQYTEDNMQTYPNIQLLINSFQVVDTSTALSILPLNYLGLTSGCPEEPVFNIHSLSIFDRTPGCKCNLGNIASSSYRQLERSLYEEELSEDPQKSYLDCYLELRNKTKYELIEEKKDSNIIQEFISATRRILYSIRELFHLIIKLGWFENFIILTIIANTVVLAIEDPAEEADSTSLLIEDIFLYIYTTECIMKIIGLGAFSSKHAYFRQKWNLIDFFIVFVSWLSRSLTVDLNLVALRAFRILRPLKSISTIPGLRVLFLTLVYSFKLLMTSTALLFFFFMIFAIAGLQLWMGLLKYRCMDLETGEIGGQELLCGDYECTVGQECVRGLDNPEYGMVNFDNILNAFLVVFQCVTLEGWSTIMIHVQKAFSFWAFLYFIPLVFIGAFFLLNLTLAVVKFSYTEIDKNLKEARDNPKQKETTLDLNRLRRDNKDSFQLVWDSAEVESYDGSLDGSNPDQYDSKQKHKLSDSSEDYSKIVPEIGINIQSDSESGSERSSSSSNDENKLSSSSSIRRPALVDLNKTFYELVHSKPSQNESFSYKEGGKSKLSSPRFGNSLILHNSNIKSSIDTLLIPSRSRENPVKSLDLNNKNCIEGLGLLGKTLRNLHSIIKIHKDVEGANKKSIDLSKLKVLVAEDYQMEYTSKEFVVLSQSLMEDVSTSYKFSYMLPSCISANSDLLKLFNTYIKRVSIQDAFDSLLLSCKESVLKLRQKDIKNKIVIGEWSGNDVDPSLSSETILEFLSGFRPRIWSAGCKGNFEKMQYPIRKFVESSMFNNMMLLFVIMNTIILGCYHYGISQEMEKVLDEFNFVFTIIFIVEMVTKLIGLGIKGYFKDSVNYLDFLVVGLSLLELFSMNGGVSSVSAFRTIRIFRIFRVLKVARLFRHLESMNQIIKVLSNISGFAYLALLLLLFITIFALLGMQLFGGKFDFEDGKPRSTFDNFHWAFLTVFQVLSLENWPVVMYDAMRSNTGEGSAIYFIVWIFLGNFVLLNLFLAILLDNFSISGSKENEELINQLDASLDCEFEFEIEKDKDKDKETDSYSKKNSLVSRFPDQKLPDINSLKLLNDKNDIYGTILDDLNDTIKKTSFEKPLFYGTECQNSYFLFSRENKFRIKCYRISTDNRFELIVLIGIVLSTIKLVGDTYILDAPLNSTEDIVSRNLDIVFTIFFTLELIIKSVSLGLILDKGSYLRETWNKLDCFIVVFSIIELSLSNFEMPVIKVFRVLRILRPLKLINHNLSMKLVVSSLLESIVALLNVGVVLLIVWVMFAILGVSLFGGKFYSCELNDIDTRDKCEQFGYEWKNNPSNFDNLIEAMYTLFIVTSLENWPTLMYLAIDATEQEHAPVRNNNPVVAYYFIVFVLINSFFFLNLFNGVLFDKFMKVKQRESSIAARLLRREQYMWVEIQKLIYKSTPIISNKVATTNPIRLYLYKLSKSKYFKNFIMLVIVINILQMAILYDEAPDIYVQVLEILNIIFSVIFCMEAVIKIIALTSKIYFSKAWNRFDFMVVCTSMIDIILSSFNVQQLKMLRLGPQLIRILRVLRVSRFIRIAKSMKNLQNQISTLIYSLPAVLNVLSLLILVMFIYAVLGSFLYNGIDSGEIINEWFNFNNFGMSMLTLVRIATGEDWNRFMNDCAEETDQYTTAIYFGSFTAVSSFVVLNLFIMVIIQEYDEFQNNPYSVPQLFRKESKKFQNAWKINAASYNKFKMHYRYLTEFIYELGDDLGMPRLTDPKKVTMLLATLDFELDNKGFVLYNELLYSILKRKYAHRLIKAKDYALKTTRICKKIIKEAETLTKNKIARIKRKVKMDLVIHAETSSGISNKYNLFITTMYARTVLKAWRNWVRNKKERLNNTISITPNFTFEVFPGDNSDATSEESGCDSLNSYGQFEDNVTFREGL